IDGIEKDNMPYDRYKIVLNCNCEISSNTDCILLGNKHNAIIFYKNGKVVRLVVLTNQTDVFACLEKALDKSYNNIKLKDLLSIKNVKYKIVDLNQIPKFNSFNGRKEMDVGSCDRMSLLNCMLNGDYTESETSFGNYDCNEYKFNEDIEITYKLKTDCEIFDIHHKGVFINTTRTKAIIIQSQGNILLSDLNNSLETKR
ncbi:MAG: hypothetical protein IJ358_02340, partial [Clostridia bacterium]|nr:hypothetical protein [Clostridia bacterium]